MTVVALVLTAVAVTWASRRLGYAEGFKDGVEAAAEVEGLLPGLYLVEVLNEDKRQGKEGA